MAAYANKDTFTTGSAARVCRVAPRTISKWLDGGKLKGYRIPTGAGLDGGDRRVLRVELLRFMVEHGIPTDLVEQEYTDYILCVSRAQQVPMSALPLGYVQLSACDELSVGEALNKRIRAVVVDCTYGREEAYKLMHRLHQRGLHGVYLASEDDASDACVFTVLQKPVDPDVLRDVVLSLCTDQSPYIKKTAVERDRRIAM